MKTSTLNWVYKCVANQKKHFKYEKGLYVYNLLNIALKNGAKSKKDLQNSPYNFLMNKPEIKTITQNTGAGVFTQDQLKWVNKEEKFFGVSVGKWGEDKSHRNSSYYQTSCPGKNLVLQLNFDNEHDIIYHKSFNHLGFNSPTLGSI